jgi:hypothetical protein
MSVTGSRSVSFSFSGDVVLPTEAVPAVNNQASPGAISLVSLATGANTITVPTGGATPTGCTIVKPSGNTVQITLKGVTGDTGVLLHKSDPDSISIDSSMTTFCLTAASAVNVRLIWT